MAVTISASRLAAGQLILGNPIIFNQLFVKTISRFFSCLFCLCHLTFNVMMVCPETPSTQWLYSSLGTATKSTNPTIKLCTSNFAPILIVTFNLFFYLTHTIYLLFLSSSLPLWKRLLVRMCHRSNDTRRQIKSNKRSIVRSNTRHQEELQTWQIQG